MHSRLDMHACRGQTEGDNTKCSSWGGHSNPLGDCCASRSWGEPQTCHDGYVAVVAEGNAIYTDWVHCPQYGRYTCMPGDSSKCTSTDGRDGYDCCASDDWGEQ